MKTEDIITIQDLIQFLNASTFDHNKKIMIYDNETGLSQPLQHIDIDNSEIILYF